MTQIQSYSKNLSIHYIYTYWIFVYITLVIKLTFIIGIVLFIYLKIQRQIKKYTDTINLFENKLTEITEKYNTLRSEFTIYKEETTNAMDELTYKIIQYKQHNQLLDNTVHLITENYNILSSEFTIYKEETTNAMDEHTHKITQYKQHNQLLDNAVHQINIDKEFEKEISETFIETTCAEINYIKTEIVNLYSLNGILIGYNFVHRDTGPVVVVPVFVSPTDTLFNHQKVLIVDCLIVSQLKFLKNVKKLDIAYIFDKMFIIDNIEMTELYSMSMKFSRCPTDSRGMCNCDRLVEENRTDYFVVLSLLLQYEGNSIALFKENVSYKSKMYVKNGIKNLYNKLNEVNIELIMPDELYDFVFK